MKVKNTRLLSLLVVTLISAPFVVAADALDVEVEPVDEAWVEFTETYHELYLETKTYADRRNGNRIDASTIQQFQRAMKRRTPGEAAIMRRMFQHMMGGNFDDEPDPIFYPDMEEIVVLGRMFDQFPMNPAEFSIIDIYGMRGIRQQANELYRDEKYDEAYPLLLELAKRGFKDSMSRLAYIFFTGTEEVDKSNLRGLGWLAASAHGESEPMFRVLYKKYMDEVPDEVRPIVDMVTAGYEEQYGNSDHIDCTTNHRYAGGIVKRTHCQFKLEQKVEACLGFDCAVSDTNMEDGV